MNVKFVAVFLFGKENYGTEKRTAQQFQAKVGEHHLHRQSAFQ